MRVLILGGGRFQGRRAAEMLVAAGHDVTILNLGAAPVAGARHIIGDVVDTAVLTTAFQHSYDCVIDNLAYNGDHVRCLLPYLPGHTGHYVQISSIVVYHGQVHMPYRPLHEAEVDLTVQAGGAYDVGKRQAEIALRDSGTPVPWTILRLANVEGAGDPSNRRGFFIDRVADGGGLLVPSDHAQPYQPLWRDDAARAAALAAGNPAAYGQTYNIMGVEIFTLNEWLGLLAQVLLVPAPYVVQLPMADLRQLAGFEYKLPLPLRPLLDVSRAQRDLGWQPTPAAAWLPETVAWWRSSGLTSGYWEDRPREIVALARVRPTLLRD